MLSLLSVTAILLWQLCYAAGLTTTSIESLTSRIYNKDSSSVGCIRLLTADSTHGCATNGSITAPVVQLTSSPFTLSDERVLLLPENLLGPVLHQISGNQSLQDLVQGVLVTRNASGGANSLPPFPHRALAPYPPGDYAWNPRGQDVQAQDLPFPAFLLSNESQAAAVKSAARNTRQGFKGVQSVAQGDASMAGTRDSAYCLKQGTCQPLGGHSVWAAFPPFPQAPQAPKDIVLVTAGMDGTGLFHDAIQAADDPMSGLVAMLTAASMLGNASSSAASQAAATQYQKRIVFAAVAGEPWGLQGTRRLLLDMAQGSNGTQGLMLELVQQVLEVGPVGWAPDDASQKLYIHSQQGTSYGNASRLVAAALQAAASVREVPVAKASLSNPGIPPSSLMAWLKAKPAIQGAVLAGFDSQYTNPHALGPSDASDTLRPAQIAAAAEVVARTVFSAATGAPAGDLPVDQAGVLDTVQQLIGCLAASSPGLACPLAKKLIALTEAPSTPRYVGVLPFLADDSQDPAGVKDVPRFLWNFMASALNTGPAPLANGSTGACGPGRACRAGAVCVGWVPDVQEGSCLEATALYTPSYSTRLNWEEYEWKVSDKDPEVPMGFPPDPIWTESNWELGLPSLQYFQRESVGYDRAVALSGVLVTLAALVASLAFKYAEQLRLKQR